MATVYPFNGYEGSNNPNAPHPQYGNQVAASPAQPSTGYAQGYYLPPTAAYPSATAVQSLPPGHLLGAPPVGQPGYPPYGVNMPAQGAYAIPQGCAQPMPTSYAGYPTQPNAVLFSAQPPTNGAYSNYNQLYGASPASTSAYPLPLPSGSQPVVVYPMAAAQASKTGSDPTGEFTMHKWNVGLCDCCHHCIPNLLMAWCCPCISLAQIYARLGLSTYRIALIRFTILVVSGAIFRFLPIGRGTSARRTAVSSAISAASGQAKPMSTSAWYIFLAVQQLVLVGAIAIARRRTRQRFQIPGNCCIDGLVSCFCPCCTIAQVATHIRSYTPGSCDMTGPDVLPPFP